MSKAKAKTKKTDFEDIVEVVEDTLEAQEEEALFDLKILSGASTYLTKCMTAN